MLSVLLADKSEEYRGVGRGNCLSEFWDDTELGEEVASFFDAYVDEETQAIRYSPEAVAKAQWLAGRMTAKDCPSEVLLVTGDETELGDRPVHKLGYDVCNRERYYSIPAEGLVTTDPEDFVFETYGAFFRRNDGRILHRWEQDLNDSGLFTTRSVAEELTAFCNRLTTELPEVLDGETEFETVSVFEVL